MPQLDDIVGKSQIQAVLDLDTALNQVTTTFLKLDTELKATAKEINSSITNFTQLNTVQQQTVEQTKKLNDAEKQNEKIAKDQADASKKITEAINIEANSIAALRKQNSELTKQRNAVNTATKEGQKAIKELNKQLDANNATIKKNVDSLTQQKINVGNYKSALEGLPGPLGAAASGIGRMGTALKALMANPIVLFIAALVMGLKLLYDSFKSTDEGADTLEQTTGALAATWKVITDRIGQVITGNMSLKESFNGVNQAILETAVAAASYAAAMDKINEKNTLYISDEAKLKKEESELTRTYKDATATTEDRIKAYERVLDIETEIMAFKKGQAKDVYRAELVNAAASQQATSFTIDQIQEFIEMDANRAEQLKDNDPKWKAFWNSNQDNIGKLENAYAALTNTETEFYDQTAKKFGTMTKFKKQLTDEEISQNAESVKAKEQAEKEKAAIDEAAKERRIQLMDEEIRYEADLYEKELQAKKKSLEDLAKLVSDYKDEEEADDLKGVDDTIERLKNTADWAKNIQDETFKGKKASIEAERKALEDAYAAGLISEEEYQNGIRKLNQDTTDLRIEEAQKQIQAISNIGQTALDFNQFLIDSETQKMEQAKAYELQLAGDNADKKAAIEKKYEKEAAKLKTKQAKQDKAQALFSAIIKTAQAVLAGLAFGPPLGYVFAALNAVLGAVQIGLIASQPIPQFFKGTESAPDGLISVGEKGRELIQTRSGKTLMANKRTLLSGMQGATIYSNQDTETLLKYRNAGYDSKELRDTLERNNDKLIKTIRDKREIHIQAPKGSRITERTGDYYKTYWTRKLN